MKTNKQKGNITSILLIITILIIIGLIIYIQKIKSIDTRSDEENSTIIKNDDKTKVTSTTTDKVELKNVDVQSSLVENATGIIKSVYTKNSKNYIDIDYVTIKPCEISRDCPSGILTNDNPLIRTFELSSNIRIKLQSGKNISYSEFLKIMQNKNDYRNGNPWDIIIKDRLIVEIVEHYRS